MIGRIGVPHRQRRAALDAGRTVADDPIEFRAQLRDDAGDAVFGERVLVAGLRGRQQIEIFQPLVANERLRQLGDAVDDVDQIEHHAPFGAHDQVEVAQPDIEVDDHDLLALLGERGTQRGRRRGLADAAFARCHDHEHLRPSSSV